MGRARIRDERTDGLTDGRSTWRLYAPPIFFGEHNKWGFPVKSKKKKLK
jgi:hypothetical protein